MAIYKALTIAGSDSSGGAGLQADLKTFQERDVYGMNALTVIVAQDENWGHNVFPVELDTIKAQIKTALSIIGVDALKTGMLFTPEIIELVGEQIAHYQFTNVVVDPVLICKGSGELLEPETVNSLRKALVPLAKVVTPNLFEAAQLSGLPQVETVEQMKEAAKIIHELGPAYVLIKGGRMENSDKAIDLLYDGQTFDEYVSEKIDTHNTHGAGCTYSAAICAELAKGKSVREAVELAKAFITEAIRHSFAFNSFTGPTYHAAYRKFGPGAQA
ncbi:pyridoxine/pyridoxal/pyridoxamine kinase [Brevibacillus fulvus]|uniref:pyridoxal kinase n=1 Tax=Brevibacillus fulvus TaxID=1125967 RepID=A0A939BNW2_9BACL|nr:pyridoxine/pyridoxal/pyridoxamine kinase [Brevibacillus fulvus]MBM7589725.1 pyridoxine kinase [Brevibacillus fulvus]